MRKENIATHSYFNWPVFSHVRPFIPSAYKTFSKRPIFVRNDPVQISDTYHVVGLRWNVYSTSHQVAESENVFALLRDSDRLLSSIRSHLGSDEPSTAACTTDYISFQWLKNAVHRAMSNEADVDQEATELKDDDLLEQSSLADLPTGLNFIPPSVIGTSTTGPGRRERGWIPPDETVSDLGTSDAYSMLRDYQQNGCP